MTSSTSNSEIGLSAMDSWLPPPSAWPTLTCGQCQAGMRVPFSPSDGLCGACRRQAQVEVPPSVEQLLADAGAPRKYAAFTRASWEKRYSAWSQHPQLHRLLGWPHQGDAGSWLLLITSPSHGARKTGLATAVLGEALAAGLRGRWQSQVGWLRDIKATWARHATGPSEETVWKRVAEAPILLFDNFGGLEGVGVKSRPERDKPWERQMITQLLHERESQQLPTIVTARLGDWRDVRRIHESLISRMNVPLKIALGKSPPTPLFQRGE